MCLKDHGTIFITGATGFIGSHLVDYLLAKGKKLRLLIRNRKSFPRKANDLIEIIDGDLAALDSLKKGCRNASLVIHLAGLVAANSKEEYEQANVIGAKNIAQCAAAAETRFVHISSQAATGPRAAGQIAKEEEEPQPVSEYGKSKLKGEEAVLSSTQERAVILRPTVVYGPGDKELLPLFKAAQWGVLPLLNDKASYSWTYVSDIVEGIIAGASKGEEGSVYHLASGEVVNGQAMERAFTKAIKKPWKIPIPSPFVSLAGAVNELLHRPFGRVPVFNRGKVVELIADSWLADTSKAREELEFEAKVSLEDGFVKTAKWYRDRGWL